MSEEFNFNIGDEAVKTIIDLRDQEPGDKEYALFLQIDGVHGNQFTYDLSFLDINQARSDDRRIDFGDLPVIIASKDIDKCTHDRNSVSTHEPSANRRGFLFHLLSFLFIAYQKVGPVGHTHGSV